jgi:hypothetical protein
MKVYALDSETEPFRPGYQAPAMVCLQWSEITPAGVGVAHVVPESEALDLLECWLADPGVHLVGAEIAYDVLCAVTSATETERGVGSPTRGKRLLTAFVEAYDADRVSDVLIRQKLIDLARGCYRYERGENDTTVGFNEYSLGGLSSRLCGIYLDKETTWRRRYHELRGVPINDWPAEARTYAANDVTATGAVWLAQWKPSTRIAANFPGKTVSDALADEFRQVRAALWIKAMSVYGLKTDPIALAQFEQYVSADYAETVEELIAGGLARRDYHVDAPACRAYIAARPDLHRAMPMARNAAGEMQPKLGEAERREYGRRDPALLCLIDPTQRFDLSSAAGLVTATEHRNTKIACQRMKDWHRARGSVPALTKEGVRRQKQFNKKGVHYDPEKNGVKDKNPQYIFDPWDYVALDKDACASTGDHLLEAYAEMTSSSEDPIDGSSATRATACWSRYTRTSRCCARRAARVPAQPNVQNQARGRKDRIGARECFVPRVGRVLIDADYSMLELHTLAQACLWMLGYSTLADELRKPGSDPHTKVGASIHGITYEVGSAALRRGRSGLRERAQLRQAAELRQARRTRR